MAIYYGLLVYVLYITTIEGFINVDHKINSNSIDEKNVVESYKDAYNLMRSGEKSEKVTIDLYYECLCPGCIIFLKNDLTSVLKKIGQYVTVNPYPYGNAKTIEVNGNVTFECQHGPKECYGNKLHACALDILGKETKGLKFITCLVKDEARKLRQTGSNDAAAEKCGKAMSIDATPIKKCAKGNKGTELLKYYGEESMKANFKYVPYVLVDGKESQDDFFKDVCAAFKNPPPECNN